MEQHHFLVTQAIYSVLKCFTYPALGVNQKCCCNYLGNNSQILGDRINILMLEKPLTDAVSGRSYKNEDAHCKVKNLLRAVLCITVFAGTHQLHPSCQTPKFDGVDPVQKVESGEVSS